MDALQVSSVTKRFGVFAALDAVNLTVKQGELFGFIGPDGAGKTTLFRLIASLLLPDSGSIRVLGFDPVKDYRLLRPRLGYMAGRFSLYPDLTVRENLEFYATIFGVSASDDNRFIREIYSQIRPFANRLAGKLSGGMKQKLALCCALVHRPQFLILDEPTTGVDAVSRSEFWQLLGEIKATGLTILVSTPYMDEASQCDRIALMQSGRLMAVESPENIRKAFQSQLFGVHGPDMYRLLINLEKADFIKRAYLFGHEIHVVTKNSLVSAGELSDYLIANGHTEAQARTVLPGIEDCFIELMS